MFYAPIWGKLEKKRCKGGAGRMAVDLRQVMAAFLTFSMFMMLGNMIKRDHIDPFLLYSNTRVGDGVSICDAKTIGNIIEKAYSARFVTVSISPLNEPLQMPANVQYDALKISKPGTVKLFEVGNGPWRGNNEPTKPCWKMPSLKGKEKPNGYIFFSLTGGPEYHASQLANAVVVARHLQAILAVPDIRGSNSGDERSFGEIYDVSKFITSLKGVVQVSQNPPPKLSRMKLPTVKVPNRVSNSFIVSKVAPIFKSSRNLKILTYFNGSTMSMERDNKLSNHYQCLAAFESLKLNEDLQELIDSMVGTLRSMSQKTNGHFVAVDLRTDILGKRGCQETDPTRKRCYSAEEIGEFLKKIGLYADTTIYLTQTTGWHGSLNALRDLFPNTFTKDSIMPDYEKAKLMASENHEYEKIIDLYICSESDVFVPAFPSRFYASVVGKRIASGNTQVMLPGKNTSSVADYISPYIAKKKHFAYSCFC